MKEPRGEFIKKLRRCVPCGQYTLEEVCARCKQRTESAYPPKFSPQDRFAEYRRRSENE